MNSDDKSDSITTILLKRPTLKKVRSDSLNGSNYKDTYSAYKLNTDPDTNS